MTVKQQTKNSLSRAKGDVVLPPWWTLLTVIFGAIFGIWLLFSTLTSGSSAPASAQSQGQVPSFIVQPGQGPAASTEPSASASAKPTPAPSTQASTPPTPKPTASKAPAAVPRVVSRETSVLTIPLIDDGNVVDVDTDMGTIPVPRNLFATAMAAFYAEVDPAVAAALPIGDDAGLRPSPVKDFKNASVSDINLVDSTSTTFTFTAKVDPDGAGPKPGRTVKRTIEETDAGYYVLMRH